MKIKPYFLLFFLGSCSLSAQTFSRIYEKAGGGDRNEIYVHDSGFVMVTSIYGDLFKLKFTEYDLLGNPLVSNTIHNYEYVPFSIAPCLNGCFEALENSKHFIMAHNHFDSSNYVYTRLTILNRQWDRLDTLNYIYKDSLATMAHSMLKDTDSTFILTGLTHYFNGIDNYDLIVARFDTTLNLLWETRVEDNRAQSYGYEGRDILVANDGNILISGYALLPTGSVTYDNVGFIAKFDQQTGSKLWLTELVDQRWATEVLIQHRSDRNYTFVGTLQASETPQIYDQHFRFGIINDVGSILLDTIIGPIFFAGPSDFLRTREGNYFVGGLNERHGYTSYAFKFSENGDSLWFRDYFHTGDTSDLSWIHHFREMPDSGFIGSGWYINRDSLPVFSYSWLLRLNEYGCLKPGCQSVGIKEADGSVAVIDIYPNPSNGIFNIDLLDELATQHSEVRITSSNGKQVFKEKLPRGENQLDLSGLPTGIYHFQIWLNNQLKGTRSIMIQTDH